MQKFILILCILSINACTTSSDQHPINPIRKIDNMQRVTDYATTPFITSPTFNNYSICHGNGCAEFAFIQLTEAQWERVEGAFLPIAANAKQERQQIKAAIALLESFSGDQSGTYKDQAENALTTSKDGQLDCIDEATNTTVYLRMMANAGLLRFHQQASRTSRGGVIIPHNTATIIESESQQRYAVDSWFEANGEPPYIVPLTEWRKGWRPEQE